MQDLTTSASIKKGAKEKVSTELQAEAFQLLVSITKATKYRHYEISNFALPGMESKHNSAYWHGKPYLGFGPSAHSFSDRVRSWNISNNIQYLQSIESNHRNAEMERLTEMDLLNEYIMTHLRLDVGISAEAIKGRWGTDQVQRIESKMVGYEQLEKVVKTTEGWKLTDNGKFFADGIAADLFWV